MVDREGLGPAERIINTLLVHKDHMVHNRPGFIVTDARSVTGVRWFFATHKEEDGQKVVYRNDEVRQGRKKKTTRVRVGVMNGSTEIRENGRVIGHYQPAGIFGAVATWMYKQVAEVWQLDNEFAARWASYAFKQEHKDLKVVLAAFMLVQSRKGDPVVDEGKVAFYDQDFRDVGEAMMLLYGKDWKGLDAKQLLRIKAVLEVPEIAKLNYEMGFAKSDRKPFMGRYYGVVRKWLKFREENVPLLKGLIKSGQRGMVRELAIISGYKPQSPRFFELLRWHQRQSKHHAARSIEIGKVQAAGESWDGLVEGEICERIEKEKPGWKLIDGRLVAAGKEATRAIFAAAIEAGSMSDKDLIIMAPTLEDLGLFRVQEIKARVQDAISKAEDMRAANIAKRVQTKEVEEMLEAGADAALQKQVEAVVEDFRIYILVDVSSSMQGAIETAKGYLAQFVQGIPLDRLHVAVFNSAGREIKIPHASAAGVRNAFMGVSAGGCTDYGAGVRAIQHHRPKDGETVVMLYVGDEGANDFAAAVRRTGFEPAAFGLLRVVSPTWPSQRTCVQNTAGQLGIPCFMLDENTFKDPYEIPRALRHLIEATPVQANLVGGVRPVRQRENLVDKILKTELLTKPAWA
jgi:hypothetical protein